MSHVKKIISSRQVHLFRRALSKKFQLSRDNVNFYKTPDGIPEADQISTFYRIKDGRGIDKLERMYLWDINPGYFWKRGIMRSLEAGTYIFYGNLTGDIEKVYIPTGDLRSTVYFDDDHDSFSMQSGDFIVHPLPNCTILTAQQNMNLFELDYAPYQDKIEVLSDHKDDPGYSITVAMALKKFSLIEEPNKTSWSLVPL
jgi:hypothetical protein